MVFDKPIDRGNIVCPEKIKGRDNSEEAPYESSGTREYHTKAKRSLGSGEVNGNDKLLVLFWPLLLP